MLSIIITTYKEPNTLGRAIESIYNQDIDEDHEIIISTPDEETLNVAKEWASLNNRIKIIKDRGIGKPAALNMIFKEAKGDILILTDGDVYIGKNSINTLVNGLRANALLGAISGRPVPQETRDSKYGYWAHFLLNAAHEDRTKRYSSGEFLCLSGYLFAMKNLNLQIAEDALDDAFISQTIWKKGYNIGYEPKATVYIKSPSNFSDWLKQKRRNTSSDLILKKYFGEIQTSRSFTKEASKFYKVFTYAESLKEFCYSSQLLFARLIVWWLGFWDTKIKKKQMKQIWVRVESTK